MVQASILNRAVKGNLTEMIFKQRPVKEVQEGHLDGTERSRKSEPRVQRPQKA